MIIKASASLRNDYVAISNLAKETKEPIYITKNGEGDIVLMDINAFEKREQVLNFGPEFCRRKKSGLMGRTQSVLQKQEKD